MYDMKTKARFSVMILALGMALSAAGCSAGKPSSSASSAAAVSASSAAGVSGTSETEIGASAVMGSVTTETEAASLADAGDSESDGSDSSEESVSSAAGSEGAFEPGTNSSSVYNNSYFGISFRLPQNWIFADEAQLQEMNHAISDTHSAEEIRAALGEGQCWFDMYATSDDGYQNVNITVQNIKAVYGAPADAETLADASLEPLKTALTGQGAQDLSIHKETMTFAGEPAVCLRINGTIEGIPFHETQTYMENGSYILCATAVSYSDDKTASALKSFKRS